MNTRSRISVVAAARPNFMKVGPVIHALTGWADVELVHTGQHYDRSMSEAFFHDLGLPEPNINLCVGSGTHAEQTGGTMITYERHLMANPSDAIVVVGDVNSTMAAALVGAKLGIPVAHVEAGLRSNDWTMPEEINRVVTDCLSTWLFTPSSDADDNLRAEGIEDSRIHLVGNVMIDTLIRILPSARDRFDALAEELGLPTDYAVVTLHRPGNVDKPESLRPIVDALEEISRDIPTFFSVHPRTRTQLERLADGIPRSGIHFLEPVGYRDFLAMLDRAKLVLTDSGGIQEETSVLGIPCLTLRANTERPITCRLGTNRVVGTQPEDIIAAAEAALIQERRPTDIPLWDGHAAERIADVLLADLQTGR
jgi:UDP-N-acetylglucosamine 2-epimerase (non-hydrolysing)